MALKGEQAGKQVVKNLWELEVMLMCTLSLFFTYKRNLKIKLLKVKR